MPIINILIKLKYFFSFISFGSLFFIIWESDRFSLWINGAEYPIYLISFLLIFHILDFLEITSQILTIIRPFISSGFLLLSIKLASSLFLVKDVVLSKFSGFLVIKQNFTVEEKLNYLLHLFNASRDKLPMNLRSKLIWDENAYQNLAEKAKNIEEASSEFLSLFTAQTMEAKKLLIEETQKLAQPTFSSIINSPIVVYGIFIVIGLCGMAVAVGVAGYAIRYLTSSFSHLDNSIEALNRASKLNTSNITEAQSHIKSIYETLPQIHEKFDASSKIIEQLSEQVIDLSKNMEEISSIVEIARASGIKLEDKLWLKIMYETFKQNISDMGPKK